jgi:DNA-binding NtrC family response regulator
MIRPCFLVVDRETSSGISTRKLVIETAKFNVITAYSSREAIDTLARFPAIDGVVADAGMEDLPCTELVSKLKKMQPAIPIIVICTPTGTHCKEADHNLESFDPRKLLDLLERMQPEATARIEKRNEQLERDFFGS